MTQYEDCIIFLLAKAYQKAHGNFKEHLLPYGMTPVQHLILETLWEEEGLTASEIGKRLVLDNATLSGVLDRKKARRRLKAMAGQAQNSQKLKFSAVKSRNYKQEKFDIWFFTRLL